MKLTIRKSGHLEDWYLIERAEHDGRSWLEDAKGGGVMLMVSARFSDADVEGTGEEMTHIAYAIENRGSAHFRRCSVTVSGDYVAFSSPRNSTTPGICSLAEADELAALIRKTVAS